MRATQHAPSTKTECGCLNGWETPPPKKNKKTKTNQTKNKQTKTTKQQQQQQQNQTNKNKTKQNKQTKQNKTKQQQQKKPQKTKTVTYANNSPKMVDPRDIAGTSEEEEEGEEEEEDSIPGSSDLAADALPLGHQGGVVEGSSGSSFMTVYTQFSSLILYHLLGKILLLRQE